MNKEESKTKKNKIIIISEKVMNEQSSMNNLWTVELLKYSVKVENDKVMTMFDSEAEVNVMLYAITLKLKLTACSKVAVHMKEAENHKSIFISYISDVLMCIENMRVL